MSNLQRKITKKILKTIAKGAMKTSEVSANSACWYMLYQDKAPESLKQLHRKR